jgi:hypothetical protein
MTIGTSIADQAGRLDILIAETRRRLPEPLNAKQLRTFADDGEKQLSALFVAFEDRYRGRREDIMQRQSFYLPHVRAAAWLPSMAEARCFVRVEVLPLQPVPAQRRDYDDPMLALLQDKLYGPQDYGLVAWKAK